MAAVVLTGSVAGIQAQTPSTRTHSASFARTPSFVVAQTPSTRTDTPAHVLRGMVREQASGDPLAGANVMFYALPDSTLLRGASSNAQGEFRWEGLPDGRYLVRVSFIGFEVQHRQITLQSQQVQAQEQQQAQAQEQVQEQSQAHEPLVFEMVEEPFEMDEVRIEARLQRMEVRGDTTIFNADAFTTRPDAVAEDLLRRMPGFEIQDGEIRAQGERITRVLVDGEDFFQEDPNIALRNLPASMISQIQVFDRQSDQARFTGFEDSDPERALNIVTRSGLREGRFGRLSGSLGTDDRYMGGGNANFFQGQRRISLIGLTNNMNQQNFSAEDLVGVTQSSTRGGGAFTGGRGGAMASGGAGGMMGAGAFGGAQNFLAGQRGGINTVHSFGVNYVDRLGDDLRVNASYFLNANDNTSEQWLERRYLEGRQEHQLYDERSDAWSESYGHRFNARIEYRLDERRSVVWSPSASLQGSNSMRSFNGATWLDPAFTAGLLQMINESNTHYDSDSRAWNLNNSLLLRRSFDTRGRTFSVNFRGGVNERDASQLQQGQSIFYDTNQPVYADDQNSQIYSATRSVSADIQFTEPLGERSQLMVSYRPSWNVNTSDRDAWLLDELTGLYTRLDERLSSRYENTGWSHHVRTGLRHSGENFRFNVGLSFGITTLNGEQSMPVPAHTDKTFRDLLPNAMVTYQFSRTRNLMFNYRTRTRIPSAAQLQDVIDNTNPLQLTGGNPDLSQEYTHSWSVRYRSVLAESGRSITGFANVDYTSDYIGNVTFTAMEETLLRDGIILGRGARLISPENIGSSWSLRTMLTLGQPVRPLAGNLNLSSGVLLRGIPVVVNEQRSESRNTTYNASAFFSTNISPDADVSLSYRAAYSFVNNSLQPERDRRFYSGNARAAAEVRVWKGLVLASDITLRHFSGEEELVNEDVVYWNGAIAYRFLPAQAAEVRFTVVDILASNSDVNRYFSDTYIEDVRTQILGRYAMFTFRWNFRQFLAGSQPQRGPGMWPGGEGSWPGGRGAGAGRGGN